MKNLIMITSLSLILFMSACTEAPSKDGGDQLPQPVQNSGPNLEGERAIEAVKDSADDNHHRADSGNIHSQP